MQLYETGFTLLKELCDGMLRYQIGDMHAAGLDGALLCPACSMVHGRCHSAVHPLLYMARKTGETAYARAAERLLFWSDHMACPDGGLINDTVCEWKGTTAFSAIAFTEALRDYADLLSDAAVQKLRERVEGTLAYLYQGFNNHSGNINYLAGVACALEIGGRLLDNPDYREKGRACAHEMLAYFTENGLLYGEGERQWESRSPKGCVAVDIGYNVEESLNLLTIYALSANDETVLHKTLESAQAHANFLLPDGGWNNSFGTRMDKWTMWGSRTSDGCQAAYTMLSRRDPRLADAARRNLLYMASCVHDGLLYGGRDLYRVGEPPCIHHTFTHAQGLTAMLEWIEKNGEPAQASAEELYCTAYYPELDTHLYHALEWHASVTGYDSGEKAMCHPSGGALSLLYHRDAGLLFTSSMSRYFRYEIMNTQRHLRDVDTPLTIRLQKGEGTLTHASILDKTAEIRQTAENAYEVRGKIADENGAFADGIPVHFTAAYTFAPGALTMRFTHDSGDIDLYLPVISPSGEPAVLKDGVCIIRKPGAIVTIQASQPLSLYAEGRIFNHVPGLEAVPLKVKDAARQLIVTVKAERTEQENG